MRSKTLVIWGAAALVLAVGVVLLMRPAAGTGVEEASPDRIAALVAEGVRVIDVRTPGEYETSHIPGAENVPVDVVRTEALGWDRAEPIVIYCTTGARSAEVVRFLAAEGFERVHHFTAGLVAWGGELERGSEVAAMPPGETPTDMPVMYEFYTDW